MAPTYWLELFTYETSIKFSRSIVVRDHNGQQLAYVYFEDEGGRHREKARTTSVCAARFGWAEDADELENMIRGRAVPSPPDDRVCWQRWFWVIRASRPAESGVRSQFHQEQARADGPTDN